MKSIKFIDLPKSFSPAIEKQYMKGKEKIDFNIINAKADRLFDLRGTNEYAEEKIAFVRILKSYLDMVYQEKYNLMIREECSPDENEKLSNEIEALSVISLSQNLFFNTIIERFDKTSGNSFLDYFVSVILNNCKHETNEETKKNMTGGIKKPRTNTNETRIIKAVKKYAEDCGLYLSKLNVGDLKYICQEQGFSYEVVCKIVQREINTTVDRFSNYLDDNGEEKPLDDIPGMKRKESDVQFCQEAADYHPMFTKLNRIMLEQFASKPASSKKFAACFTSDFIKDAIKAVQEILKNTSEKEILNKHLDYTHLCFYRQEYAIDHNYSCMHKCGFDYTIDNREVYMQKCIAKEFQVSEVAISKFYNKHKCIIRLINIEE